MAIRIDNSEAKTKLTETKEQISALRDELKQMDADGRKNTAEYKDKKAQLDKLNNTYAELRKEVGKTALSYEELRVGARKLKREMDKAIPDTENWRKLRADYIQTKQRMKELEVQATETRFSISKVADGFNRYAAMGAGLIASLTGVVLTARQCVDEFAKMEEAESQVRKYTGMTREEVKALNEEFKNMDTRTSREKLNALAGDAGKLGITGKKDVMDFVDAANMINVALGEDLGEDAVKNIGKLAQMFGEDKTMGLRGAMLATGSAVNAVGQASSAAEGYLVGFTARVAGASKQAGIAQGNIIGYAAVLDQNMQQQEMAATAFQTLLMKMYQEPTKFAKLAGKSVKEFTTLIKTDANEAILQFLETLNKKGGLDKLAPMFKDMGLDGVRASGVISTMAGKINDIRAAQKLANQAYREGTSIINEYNVQNTTVQAELDKAKKHFADVRVELGEKLMPVMKYMITTGSLTVKGLSAIISVFFQYKGAILSLTTAIVAYTAVVKLNAIATTLLNNLTKVTTTTVNGLTRALVVLKSVNWWGVAIAGATALISYFTVFRKKTDEVSVSMQANQRIAEKVRDEYGSQEAKVNRLVTAINNENASLSVRRKYLEQLKKIIPGYNAMITDEGKIVHNNANAIKLYLQQLEKQIRLRAAQDELEDLLKKKRAGEIGRKVYRAQLESVYSDMNTAGYGGIAEELQANPNLKVVDGPSKLLKYTAKYDELNEKIKKRDEELKQISSTILRLNGEIAASDALITDEPTGSGSGYTPEEKDKKPWETKLKNEENAYNEELLLLRKKSDELGRTETEYQLSALQKESEYQLKRLAIVRHYQSTDKDKKHLAELNKMEVDARSSLYSTLKGSEENRLKLLKEYRDRRLDAISQSEKEAQSPLSKQYEDGLLSERDYKNRLLAIEVSSASARLEINKDYQSDVEDLEFKNGETKANAIKEAGDEIIKAEKQISEKRAEIIQDSSAQVQNFNRSFLKANGLASTKDQLSALESFYQSQVDFAKKSGLDTTLITSSYEEAKRTITEKGAEDRAEVIRKYGLKAAEDSRDLKLKVLEDEHKRGLLSEEEYEKAKNQIANEYLQEKLEANEQYFNAVSSIAGTLSSAIQGFQDAEVSKVSRKYDKQITAAKKAGKDTTKLEEEKEEAVNQVKKKYADKQFAAAVMQITASTAVAAMEAYKAMAGIPIVGPALGAAAAAAALISGAAQIAVAKEQRDEAKGLKSGGYSDDYIQGYTSIGNPDDVAGVIPVHKNEFVTNHDGVANPHVKQFLDVFDVAQKNGSIRMINTTQILEQVRTKSGKYSGGYSEDTVSNAVETTLPSNENKSQVVSLLVDIKKILGDISDKEWTLDPRKVRDAIKRVETLESNVSRS